MNYEDLKKFPVIKREDTAARDMKMPSLISRALHFKRSMYETHRWESYPEVSTFYYIKNVFPDTINWYRPKWLVGKNDVYSQMEVDIFIPSIDVAIEIDGNWHSDPDVVDSDTRKGKKLKTHKIHLIRMRMKGLPDIDDGSFKIVCCPFKSHGGFAIQYDYPTAIHSIFQHLIDIGKYNGEIPDINLDRDVDPIFGEYGMSFSRKDPQAQQLCSFKYFHPVPKEESIAVLHPEWDKLMDEYNGDIRSDMVSPWSSVKLWWKCPKCGGFYPASPLEKMRGMGCWHCENRCVLMGFNDFKTTHPDLEKYYKKDNLIPSDMRVFDPYESVKWICARCGGTAQATFREAEKKHGILYCYSCRKEMPKIGHKFYNIEDNAVREIIGEEAYERRKETDERIYKKIHTPPTNPESKDFKLKDLVDKYRADKKDTTEEKKKKNSDDDDEFEF